MNWNKTMKKETSMKYRRHFIYDDFHLLSVIICREILVRYICLECWKGIRFGGEETGTWGINHEGSLNGRYRLNV